MPKNGEHNKWIALALCILLGYLGLHRFYEGKIATGILWLCTGGFFGIGIIIDAIVVMEFYENLVKTQRRQRNQEQEHRFCI